MSYPGRSPHATRPAAAVAAKPRGLVVGHDDGFPGRHAGTPSPNPSQTDDTRLDGSCPDNSESQPTRPWVQVPWVGAPASALSIRRRNEAEDATSAPSSRTRSTSRRSEVTT